MKNKPKKKKKKRKKERKEEEEKKISCENKRTQVFLIILRQCMIKYCGIRTCLLFSAKLSDI